MLISRTVVVISGMGGEGEQRWCPTFEKKNCVEKVQWESLGCLLDLSQEKVEYWVQEG